MNLEEQILSLKKRGFSQEQAEIIILMREAAVVLFCAFPESFLLYGGANLIFFHNSTRHSADLDLLTIAGEVPGAEEIGKILIGGLKPLADFFNIAAFEVKTLSSDPSLTKIRVMTNEGRSLFTVDLTRLGSVLVKEIEEQPVESASSGAVIKVKSASRDLLLLQKSEAFLLRKQIKVRDAYDIKVLTDAGARLHNTLLQHLEDNLRWQEIDKEQILERIGQVDARRCEAELSTVLSEEKFQDLKSKNFEPLRDVLLSLFANWL